jgi:hypothetical protein
LGSKNNIFLGVIIDLILHHHRNFFTKKDIRMSKRVQDKIKDKHPNVFNYTNKENFSILLSHTIASTKYDSRDDTLNFIAYIKHENRFVLYALKKEKHHTICNTIFSLRPTTLKKYYERNDFKAFNNRIEIIIEEYIKS